MCDFCKGIKRISYGEEIESTEKDFAREKIILCYIDDKLCFYGFNKYHYEDDAYYGNADINYCPMFGRKLVKGVSAWSAKTQLRKLKKK